MESKLSMLVAGGVNFWLWICLTATGFREPPENIVGQVKDAYIYIYIHDKHTYICKRSGVDRKWTLFNMFPFE